MLKELTVREVGRMFGFELPRPDRGKRGRSKCPIRKHKRRDPTFRVFMGRGGVEICKCWSCDPPNSWDSVGLYAVLSGVDRKEAWKRLKQDGYAVPGMRERGEPVNRDDEERSRHAYVESQKKLGYGIPIVGTRPEKVLALDPSRWAKWAASRTGELERFAEKRGIPAAFMREHGVIEMGGPYVGFTYFHPDTKKPVRVKVRGVDEKVFWVEPRPPKGDASGARADDVLYLAHELEPGSPRNPVIIVEGEPDALAIRSTGIRNVISLPDGSESWQTSNLEPLRGRFLTWIIALDDDAPGNAAVAGQRARSAGALCARVKWKRLVGDEMKGYKDANAALLDGFTAADFIRCVTLAAEAKWMKLEWKLDPTKVGG